MVARYCGVEAAQVQIRYEGAGGGSDPSTVFLLWGEVKAK
jgi:hypothetical protein